MEDDFSIDAIVKHREGETLGVSFIEGRFIDIQYLYEDSFFETMLNKEEAKILRKHLDDFIEERR